MNSTQIKSEETELLVLNLSLGSELVPSYLTKIPFDHVILEDTQSMLLLLPTICGYTSRVSHTKSLHENGLSCQCDQRYVSEAFEL